MKRQSAILLAATLSLLAGGVQAEYGSLFGDNTGRTVGGVHVDRYDNNTQSGANAGIMDEASFVAESQGDEAF